MLQVVETLCVLSAAGFAEMPQGANPFGNLILKVIIQALLVPSSLVALVRGDVSIAAGIQMSIVMVWILSLNWQLVQVGNNLLKRVGVVLGSWIVVTFSSNWVIELLKVYVELR